MSFHNLDPSPTQNRHAINDHTLHTIIQNLDRKFETFKGNFEILRPENLLQVIKAIKSSSIGFERLTKAKARLVGRQVGN